MNYVQQEEEKEKNNFNSIQIVCIHRYERTFPASLVLMQLSNKNLCVIRMSEQITLERSAFSNMHADRRKMTEVIDNRASRYFINED